MIQCPECKLIPANQDAAALLWATCNRCGASFHAAKRAISNAELTRYPWPKGSYQAHIGDCKCSRCSHANTMWT